MNPDTYQVTEMMRAAAHMKAAATDALAFASDKVTRKMAAAMWDQAVEHEATCRAWLEKNAPAAK